MHRTGFILCFALICVWIGSGVVEAAFTPTDTPTNTATITATGTPSNTPINTPTRSATATPSGTATPSATITTTPNTMGATATFTPTLSFTPTTSPSMTVTSTPNTLGATATFTPTVTSTPNTATVSATMTITPTPPQSLAFTPSTSTSGPVTLAQNVVRPSLDQPVRIQVRLDQASPVHIAIYTRGGRLVKTIDADVPSAGTFEAVWAGVNQQGQVVGSGVYVVYIRTKTFEEKRKVVVIR